MLKKLIKRDFKNQKKETFNLRTYPFLIYESNDYKFFFTIISENCFIYDYLISLIKIETTDL